ncbi:MAG: divalent-cation tolerance protein CutA [Verrucomicrobia bacterium]|nr:divalent-cation tolerance protein CutA [Verrucomicrobiota bacterium]MBI3867809.1 divalent-cation tolerance protein CutA [Verrucomicrobiota bacterium]
MKRPPSQCRVCLVTAPDLRTARRLARAVLERRLAACANILPSMESHYWWEGKLQKGREVLILFKTTQARWAAFRAAVKALHPYDTPEIIALSVGSGYERYLKWVSESVTGP